MFDRVLVANRGEIAVRIIRTLKEMGIRSIATYSDSDRDALFVEEADEAYRLGPAPAAESYLNIDALLAVARQSGADALHPGYGFLAENADFAQAAAAAAVAFIGPSARAIRLMGDKVQARRLAESLGVPVVPGTPDPVSSVSEANDFAQRVGFPVAVKAAGGGGGRGIRVVNEPREMSDALASSRREAMAYFHSADVYLERYFSNPRHVEIQVLGDRRGHLVHLGERDCSVQRRHQKLIEESPSPAVDRELRNRLGDMALRVAQAVDYTSAGTIEFLLTQDSEFYFLEMNTRIQVEHPVTECVTGVDLIREMVLAAAGEPITVPESVLDPRGHAIEVRVNAEDAAAGFRPTPAFVSRYREPGGIGIRMDSGVEAGFTIPQEYDSLVSKLIAWAPDREAARRRALRALAEYRIEGPATTIPFARAILENEAFRTGDVGTAFIGAHLDELIASIPPEGGRITNRPAATMERGEDRAFEVEVNRKLFQVRLTELSAQKRKQLRTRPKTERASTLEADAVHSPMHGTVIGIGKQIGESVEPGETLFVIEAMKMENEISAQRGGTVRSIDVEIGQAVETDQRLATIE